MLVFSSALRTRSNGSRRSPSQYPAYRSRTRAALRKKSGSRGKSQCSYCHGLMASASRSRATVVRLIGLPRSAVASRASEANDCRLNGVFVRATRSHARAVTRARSRGGKGRLPAPTGLVLQRELPARPTAPPPPNGVRVKGDGPAGRDVGEGRPVVQEEDQPGPLAEVGGGRPGADEAIG